MNFKLVKPQMILLHPHKIMIKTKRMNMRRNKKDLKMKIKLTIKMRPMMRGGGIRMMGIMNDQGQSHLIQECIKPFKEITPWT
jgi:hypothetical protein